MSIYKAISGMLLLRPMAKEGDLSLKRQIMCFILMLSCITTTCSCALLRQPLDKMSGFSGYLRKTETAIRKGKWPEAAENLRKSTKAWYRVKPFLQIDIDHDYVHEIEADFIRLRANIETRNKPNSLVSIFLIQDNWRDIGSM